MALPSDGRDLHDHFNLVTLCLTYLADGKIVALGNPKVAKQLLGTDMRNLKDATGKVYDPDLFAGM